MRIRRSRGSQADRLAFYGWSEDSTTGCWIWSGPKNYSGYGRIMINRKHKAVHRIAYETWVGPIPDGHIVRHRCDNPPCINPIHLETGTWGDNMKDKVERGRLVVPLGSSNGQAKLTEAKVLEMRSLYASGEYTYRDLADLYGVSISTAYPAITGKTWRHVRVDTP